MGGIKNLYIIANFVRNFKKQNLHIKKAWKRLLIAQRGSLIKAFVYEYKYVWKAVNAVSIQINSTTVFCRDYTLLSNGFLTDFQYCGG